MSQFNLQDFIAAAIKKTNIPTGIEVDALNLARSYKEPTEQDFYGRVDLRKVPFVTIDGADSKDFDDAVWAEKTKDGYHVRAAIADVAYYVRPGDPLDEHSRERGNSVYLPTHCIPMLPEELSNNLCSLKPNVDRLSVTVDMHIDKQGNIIWDKCKVIPTVIHSHARLTYKQSQQYWSGSKNAVIPEVRNSLDALFGAYKARVIESKKRSKADYDSVAKYFTFSKRMKPVFLSEYETFESNRVIEEMMVLSNTVVAKLLHDKGVNCINRLHTEPTGDKRVVLERIIDEYKLPKIPKDGVTPQYIQHCINSVDESERKELRAKFLKTSTKAVYCCEETGHFGLALEHYAHFTSPIRRRSDLLLHRQVYKAFRFPNWRECGVLPEHEDLVEECAHITKTEIAASNAANLVDNMLTADYYGRHIGKEAIPAEILRIQTKDCANGSTEVVGIQVSLDKGMARATIFYNQISHMYKLSTDQSKLVHRRDSKQSLQVGDSLKVKVVKVRPMKGTIDVTLADMPAKTAKQKQASKQKAPKHKNQQHVGQTFEGAIVGIKPYGVIVKLHKLNTTAVLTLSGMKDDFYHHDKSLRQFKGETSKRILKVGYTVQVKLTKISPKKGTLLVELLN